MPVITFGARDLLEYNAQYRLLICRECKYAIQKNALKSHLLRHKIYRDDRQRLLSSIAQLDLLEPLQVPLPAPCSPPVDALPVLSGYCCTAAGCQHLTASSKRMERHWSAFHGLAASVPLSPSFARAVKLQTFFRGTKVRYFEVASPTAPLVNTGDDSDDKGDDQEGCQEEEGQDAITATPAPAPCMPDPPRTTNDPSPANFDLETLTYFHHFITITSLTLPCAEDPQSAKHYWQTHIVLRALRRRWLMCGLMAISARHLATLADDTMTKRIHWELEAQFSSEFSEGLEQTTECNLGLDAVEIEEEAKKTGQQIRCLLRCAQWTLAELTLDYEPVAPCQLLSILSTLRGCLATNSTFRYSSVQNDSHGRQEEVLGQGSLHMKNLSHAENQHRNSFSDRTPSVLLNLLHTLPSSIAEGLGRPESAQDVFATLSAITTVVECCKFSFACDEVGAAWQGVATWLANVPDHFNQMIRRDHPAALVVVAHGAAILIKRAEHVGCWFLKGSAKFIMVQIARQLFANRQRAVLGLVESLMDIVKD